MSECKKDPAQVLRTAILLRMLLQPWYGAQNTCVVGDPESVFSNVQNVRSFPACGKGRRVISNTQGLTRQRRP